MNKILHSIITIQSSILLIFNSHLDDYDIKTTPLSYTSRLQYSILNLMSVLLYFTYIENEIVINCI